MDLSSFSNFYEKNSDEIDGLAINLLNNFIKKDDPKPKTVYVPSPTINQTSSSPATDKTMYWVAGGVAVLVIVAVIAFRK